MTMRPPRHVSAGSSTTCACKACRRSKRAVCTALSVFAYDGNGTHGSGVRYDNTKKDMEYPSLSETVNKAINNTGLKTIVLKDRQGVEQAVAIQHGPQTIPVFEDDGNPTGPAGVRLLDHTVAPDPADPADYLKFIADKPIPVAEDGSDTVAVWQDIPNLLDIH